MLETHTGLDLRRELVQISGELKRKMTHTGLETATDS